MSRFKAVRARVLAVAVFTSSVLTLLSLAPCTALAGSTAGPQPLPYTITAVAGGGTLGTTFGTSTVAAKPYTAGQACAAGSSLTATDAFGDGCLATQILVGTPRAQAADSQGNVFFIDGNNALIRRVDARSGIISTVAGQGTQGRLVAVSNYTGSPLVNVPVAPVPYGASAACAPGSSLTAQSATGDGCLATQVALQSPEGMTFDAAGNLWFTDYTLGAVREISHATGIITTIVNTANTLGYMAGNVGHPNIVVSAASGLLYHPYGLTFDLAGNLYIADMGNDVVDVVNLTPAPEVIANVMILNSSNQSVPYPIPSGAIFTIAGLGCTYGPSTGCDAAKAYGKGPSGTASTAASLDTPYQVAVDQSGNIYIADEFPYDVRLITASTGINTTFVNTGFTKVSGAIARGPAATTNIASVYGVATGPLGNVYVAIYDSTTSSSYVARVDAATQGLYLVAGQYVTAAPSGPLVGGTGAKYCGTSTDPVGDGCPATQATFYRAYQPFVDPAGNLYVSDQTNGLVRKVSAGTQFPAIVSGSSATQNLQVHFGASDTPASSAPYTLAPGFSDFSLGAQPACVTNSDTTTDCVVSVTFSPSTAGLRSVPLTIKSSSGLVSIVPITGTGVAPVLAIDPGTQTTLSSTGLTAVAGLAVDRAGNAFAAVPNASALVEVSAAGSQSSIGSGLNKPVAVAIDAAGNLYVAQASGAVQELPAGGAAAITLGSGFTSPSGIAVDGFGNVYVSDSGANQVSEILAVSGVKSVLASAPTLSGPAGLGVDAAGNVFVVNSVANTVVELPAAGGSPIVLAGASGLASPDGLALDAAGSLYIADTRNGRILYLPSENGTFNAKDQIAIVSALSAPTGVAVANNGTVFVTDSTANTLTSFTRTSSTIAFGNDALGTAVTAPADLISMGNSAVGFGSTFETSTGNTSDFSLSPSTLPASSSFPASGFGLAVTAAFNPTAIGSRSAAYTFSATNVPALTLNVTGNGINPVDATTTRITATPTIGSYGQTVTATVTVAAAPGLPVPSGAISFTVDNTTTTQQISAAGTYTYTSAALSTGTHTFAAKYTGDTLSNPSTATPVTITLAPAALSIVVNNQTKVFAAALPTLTGVVTGAAMADATAISAGVTYTTSAMASSPLGSYPINASVPVTAGSIFNNYTVTITPGVLTVVKAPSMVLLSASSNFVNSGNQVTLTAAVTGVAAIAGGAAPTGTVTFLNGTTTIGMGTLSAAGVATYTGTFASGAGTSSALYNVVALYSGDANFAVASSTSLSVTSGFPTFTLTPSVPTGTAISVPAGQTALLTAILTPTFNYSGTITLACTGNDPTVSCVFTPNSFAAAGNTVPLTIGVSLTTQQAGPRAALRTIPGAGSLSSPVAFAAVPGLAILFGLASRRRRWFRGAGLLVLAFLAVLTFGLSGCGAGPQVAPTPSGSETIVVTATGSGGGFANVSQQFTVLLKIQ